MNRIFLRKKLEKDQVEKRSRTYLLSGNKPYSLTMFLFD